MAEPLFSFRAGLKEAHDIVLYLKPLQILLEETEQADFTMVCWQENGHWAGAGLSLGGSRDRGLPGCGWMRGPRERLFLPRGGGGGGGRSWSCGAGRAETLPPSARPARPSQLPTFIAKVLDTVCFIWATSEHYNTPSRVIVILQEFCNQLIETVAPPGLGRPPLPAAPVPSSRRHPQQLKHRQRC